MNIQYSENNINSSKFIKDFVQWQCQIGNLSSDFNFSIVLHTFPKIHNFLISYPILLKLFMIGVSDFLLLLKVSYFWSGLVL